MGGWQFNILPYIEQQALHDRGSGGNVVGIGQTAGTPLTVFQCPARRKAVAYPNPKSTSFGNLLAANTPGFLGRSDYAGCSGDAIGVDWPTSQPTSYSSWVKQPLVLWQQTWTGCESGSNPSNGSIGVTGVICRHSRFRMASITDGTANTYLLGEKYMMPDHYLDGTADDDDQCWSCGYDYDVNRWTTKDSNCVPMQDMPGYGVNNQQFGSAHAVGFHMAFCDGSVHLISYSIDQEPTIASAIPRRPDDRRQDILTTPPHTATGETTTTMRGLIFIVPARRGPGDRCPVSFAASGASGCRSPFASRAGLRTGLHRLTAGKELFHAQQSLDPALALDAHASGAVTIGRPPCNP